MGTSLTGNNISASYLGLLKSTDSQAISSTVKRITDGAGNDLPLSISTSTVRLQAGTLSAPSLSFGSNSEGFYVPSDENIGFVIAGTEKIRLNSDGLSVLNSKLTLNNDQKVRWTSDDVYIQGTTSADNIQLGVGGATQFTFAQTTGMRLHQYGSGNITGTVTQRLGVTSTGQVVEIPIGAGAIDGSGTAGKIAKFTDSDTLGDSLISESGSTISINGTVDANSFTDIITDQIFTAGGSLDIDTSLTSRDVTFSQGSNTLMTIKGDASGVGIGTTSPARPLSVNSTQISARFTSSSADSQIELTDSSGTAVLGSSSGAFLVQTGSATRLTISTSGDATFAGNVGIKSAPAGNAGTNIISVGTAGSVAGGVQLWAGTSQTHFLQFGDESSTASNHYRGAIGYAHSSDTLSLIQGSVTALSFTGSQSATFAGSVNINNSSGDTLTLTKGTTEPSLRIEGDTDKDFVITVSGELLTFTQNDGATDILTLDHDTKNATFAGSVNIENASTPLLTIKDTTNNVNVLIGADDTNTFIRGSSGSVFLQTNGSNTAMTLDSSQRVGIGTTSPASKAHVAFTADFDGLRIQNSTRGHNYLLTTAGTSAEVFSIYDIDNTNNLAQFGNSSISLYTGGTERLKIDSSGNLSLESATSLDFNVADFAQIKFKESGAIMIDSDNNQSSRNFQIKDGSGSSLLTVLDTGSIGVGTTAPASNLEIFGSGNTLRLDSSANQSKSILFRNVGSGTAEIKTDGDLKLNAEDSGKTIQFFTVDTERARILANGDFVMGNTVVNPASGFSDQNGFGYDNSNGNVQIGATDDVALTLGRNESSDGTILSLRKESSVIGTLGSNATSGEPVLDISASTSNGHMRFLTNGSEAVRIDKSQNVAFGTTTLTSITSNVSTLSLGGTNANVSGGIAYQANATAKAFHYVENNNLAHQASTGVGQLFLTNNATALAINTSGNLGLGTTAPTSDAIVKFIGIVDSTSAGIVLDAPRKYSIFSSSSSTLSFRDEDAGSERLTLDSSGNFGVGTNVPTMKLTIAHADQDGLRFTCADGLETFIDFGDASDNDIGRISYDHADNHMAFRTNNSERARIDSSGNLGLGNTTASGRLSVKGADTSNSTNGLFVEDSSGSFTFAVRNDGEAVISNKLGIGETSPDLQLHIKNTATGSTGIAIENTNNAQSLDIDFYSNTGSAQGRIRYEEGAGAFNFLPNVLDSSAMYINHSTNIGVGTTSPAGKVSIVNSVQTTPTIQICNEANGGDGFEFQRWQYIEGSTNFRLGLFQEVSSGLVKYRFDLVNNATSYASNLVLDRGRIGINSAPKKTLDVVLNSTGSRRLFVSYDDSIVSVHSANDSENPETFRLIGDSIRFNTGTSGSGSEKARVTSDGIFMVNQTAGDSDADGFVVFPTGSSNGTMTNCYNGDDGIALRVGRNSDGDSVQFVRGTSSVGSVSVTSSATSYNTSSDYRLKEDLQDFNALEIASKIKMYDFKWKADDSRGYGVMAHELQEVVPQAVSGDKDAEDMQQVDYSKLVPILLKSIQELKAEIDELKKEI